MIHKMLIRKKAENGKDNPAVIFLSKYIPLSIQLKRFRDDIEECYARATDISAHLKESMVQGNGDQDRMANEIVKAMDKRWDFIMLDQRARAIQRLILEAIESLSDETQKLVLMLRYIKGYDWEKISMEINYCGRNAQYIHGRALLGICEWIKSQDEETLQFIAPEK